MKTCFILSYERPIFLWATLDALYRLTRSQVRFVFVDSASKDPLVRRVVDGFDRRGMFDEIVWLEQNNKDWAEAFFAFWHERVGDVFYFIESDAVIEEHRSKTCWANRMQQVMDANVTIAMLGSAIDRTDFVDPSSLETRLGRPLTSEEQQQIKLLSPERSMLEVADDEVVSPFNPPGRLLALRTRAIRSHLGNVMAHTDGEMHKILTDHGWQTGIYGGVRHRHLSLLNYFDYPAYSMEERDNYVESRWTI